MNSQLMNRGAEHTHAMHFFWPSLFAHADTCSKMRWVTSPRKDLHRVDILRSPMRFS